MAVPANTASSERGPPAGALPASPAPEQLAAAQCGSLTPPSGPALLVRRLVEARQQRLVSEVGVGGEGGEVVW
jgi:hypothetical protein